jgi:hypothetical protein
VRTRLNGEPMSLDWLSETTLGRMLGDYISVSWVGGRVIPVLSLAGEPGFTMAQAIFATRATSQGKRREAASPVPFILP